MFCKNVLLIFLMVPIILGVDVDYYYSTSLRSKTQVCTNAFDRFQCHQKCGDETGICLGKECYCLAITKSNDKPAKPSLESKELIPLNNMHLALRHHIAHFCPNLDVARQCISKCMEQGKPAFCGKDHVCYCGHKYSNKDENKTVNASSVYEQFKDLYKKYFGVASGKNTESEEYSQ